MKAVLVLAVLALACNVAFATHFRYMTMSWSRANPTSLDVKIKIQAAFNATFFRDEPMTQGQQIGGVGSVDFGDSNPAIPIALRVTSYSEGNGIPWFIGETEMDITYPSADVFTVMWGDCCRIVDLKDFNSEASYTVIMNLDLSSSVTQSAQVTQFPLMYFNLNQANSIQLPFLADSNGANPIFSIRTDNTGLTTASPAGLAVTPGGVVQWTPTEAGLYAIQFGADIGANSLPLDLILTVVQPTNSPPVITAPTVTTITFIPGDTVTFLVAANDPDAGDTVSISTTSLPFGSTFPACSPAQQCQQVFTWPTNGASTAQIVCFQASDDKGNPSAQKCVSLIPDVDNPCPSGSIEGVGCVQKKVSNKCVGNGFHTVTQSAGGCATLSFDEFGTGC